MTSQQVSHLRALLDVLPEAVFLVEPTTLRFLDGNSAACARAGVHRDELLARNLRNLIVQPSGSELDQQLQLLISKADQTQTIAATCRRPTDESYDCELLMRALATEFGPVLLVTLHETGRANSLVDSKRRDEQLLHAQKLESISVLASGVAHEFNNLLQIIVGVTHASMASLAEDDDIREDLQYVLDAAQKATHLTRQLLGFSQRQVMKAVEIQLRELIGDLVKMLRPIMGEHIELDTCLDDRTSTIFADPTVIQEILINLCINARDAMPCGGRVTISTNVLQLSEDHRQRYPRLKPGRYAEIQIRDTGCGMPADVLKRIFDPFYTTKELGQGTGLGLSMVYGAIQQLEGDITVESEVGVGSTFTLHIPVSRDAIAEEVEGSTAAGDAREPAEAGVETILIVDDEPIIRDFSVYALTRAGYNTLTAADGEEAMRILEQPEGESVALVLLDVIMPKMGGHETMERIRQRRPDIKAVFYSAFDPDASQVNFIKTAGLRLIQKPVNPPVLLQAVREVLDERQPCAVS